MSSKPFILAPSVVFRLLLASRLLAAYYSNISDCDEVFNYWEATHYLLKGSGFQTWEYSPVYMIRSWSYPALNAIFLQIFHIFTQNKVSSLNNLCQVSVFLWYRMFLAALSSACDTFLHQRIARYVNGYVARYFFVSLLFATGSFISTTALLPSTFAMYATSVSFALAISPSSRLGILGTTFVIGLGSLVGWPFQAILLVPFFLLDLESIRGLKSFVEHVCRWASSGIISLGLLSVPIILVDYSFYKKIQFVPLNIVLYNVINTGQGKGPDIYGLSSIYHPPGTEPWDYYLKNLFLNFNIVSVLAISSIPIVLTSWIVSYLLSKVKNGDDKPNHWRYVVQTSAFYIWLVIFSLQPHKEERFMFVVYPLICFNAGVSLLFLKSLFSKIMPGASYLLLILFAGLSISRTTALYLNYSAPMDVYMHLYSEYSNLNASSTTTLCLGKEWHRFQSHYFIPESVSVSLIKSRFSGLLPKKYDEKLLGWRSGTWKVPGISYSSNYKLVGMNDVNREETDRYVSVNQCDLIIDSDFSLGKDWGDELEPVFRRDVNNWREVKCLPFLDAAKTSSAFSRVYYFPYFLPDNRVWGQYCLLERIAS